MGEADEAVRLAEIKARLSSVKDHIAASDIAWLLSRPSARGEREKALEEAFSKLEDIVIGGPSGFETRQQCMDVWCDVEKIIRALSKDSSFRTGG